jgi:hypothetical protein
LRGPQLADDWVMSQSSGTPTFKPAGGISVGN